jgi:signal transduction histidine kinase
VVVTNDGGAVTSTVARLTNDIAAMQPAVIGFDVLLPLPDRLSPQEIIRALPSINEATRSDLMSLPSNDTLLAASFRRVPIVLGIAALPATAAIGNGSADTPVSMVAEAGDDAGEYLPQSASLIANVAELDAAASGRGMVTLVADDDGVLRRNPAAIAVRDRVFPSFAIEVARVAARADSITLAAGGSGIESVNIAGNRLATDRAGNLWLHYARAHSLQILSAADILAGRISAANIRGKLVLLGTTALAISGYYATPLGDRRAGVEIQAQLLQNILDGDVLVRPAQATVGELLLLLLAGVLLIGAAGRLRGWRLLPLFVGLPALGFGFSLFAYLHAQHLIDPTLLALLAILLYMSAATEGILTEERARRRTDFLANMSHELRTPLTAILGFSESIKNELFGPISPVKYGDYVDQIHASGGHLLAIVNDVLDMSRVAAGETKLDEIDVDLRAAADECLLMLQLRVDKKRLQVRVEFDPALPHVQADRRMVKQMLLNLLSNAVTYTPDGGSVTVTASVTSDRQVAVTVRDTGIGIARADLERIMEPFQIVENPQSRSYQGIGLGLPLARSLIQLHGGDLTLHSEIGIGTTATLAFPATRTIEPHSRKRIGVGRRPAHSQAIHTWRPGTSSTKAWSHADGMAILSRQRIDQSRDLRMPAKSKFDKSKLPSRYVSIGPASAPHRSYYYAMGMTEAEIAQPFVGVATTWNEAAPCNIALGRQAQAVKKGSRPPAARRASSPPSPSPTASPWAMPA